MTRFFSQIAGMFFIKLVTPFAFLTGLFLIVASPANAASIPMMEGETLDKVERTYPRDFGGKHVMMVMLFDQEQQEQLDGWADAIGELPEGVDMIELALIGKVNGMVKYFIKGGMRDALEDDDVRQARTMPYFGDADKVKKRMKIKDISQVQAFLLSPSGKVLWQGAGDYAGQFSALPPLSD